jgi:predicted  nucleic acid-binding Zn-ribbon protein
MEKTYLAHGLPVYPDGIRDKCDGARRVPIAIAESSDWPTTPQLVGARNAGVQDELAVLQKENICLRAQVKRLKAEVFDVSQSRQTEEIELLKAEHEARVAHLKQKYKQYIKSQIKATGDSIGTDLHMPPKKRFKVGTCQDTESEQHGLKGQLRFVQEENTEFKRQATPALGTTAKLGETESTVTFVKKERDTRSARLTEVTAASDVAGHHDVAQKELIASLRRELAAAAERPEVHREEAARAKEMLRAEQDNHKTLLAARDAEIEKLRADMQAKDIIVGEMRNTIRGNIIDMDDLKQRVTATEVRADARTATGDERPAQRQFAVMGRSLHELEVDIERLERVNQTLSTTLSERSARIRALNAAIEGEGQDGLRESQAGVVRRSKESEHCSAPSGSARDEVDHLDALLAPVVQHVCYDHEQLTKLEHYLEVLLREKLGRTAQVGGLCAQLEVCNARLAQLKATAIAAVVESQSTVRDLQGQLNVTRKQLLQQQQQQQINQPQQPGPVQLSLPPLPPASGQTATRPHLLSQLPQPLLLSPPPQPCAVPFQQSRAVNTLVRAVSTLTGTSPRALPPSQFGADGSLHAQCAHAREVLLSRISHLEGTLSHTKLQWRKSETEQKQRLRSLEDAYEDKAGQASEWFQVWRDSNLRRLAEAEARLAVLDALPASNDSFEIASWKKSADHRLADYLFKTETEWFAQLADMQAQLWDAHVFRRRYGGSYRPRRSALHKSVSA